MSLPDRRTLLALFGAAPLAAALPRLDLFPTKRDEPPPAFTIQKATHGPFTYEPSPDLESMHSTSLVYGMGYMITRETLEVDAEIEARMCAVAAEIRKQLWGMG